jgi:hypothetical protein
MFPFRTQPQAIDQVACANCDKPAWDHFITEAGAECDLPHNGTSCRFFALRFTELIEISKNPTRWQV